MPDYEYSIGLTADNLQNLEDDLGIPPPHPAPYTEWALDYECGDGTVQGDGFPSVIWHWDYIDKDGVAALRTYCTGKSAAVVIRTVIADGETYDNFDAIMIWPTMPDDSSFQMGRASTDFVLRFTHLEAA